MLSTPFLLTPGPVSVPAFVLQAMQRPVMHHRDAAWATFYANLQAQLKALFITESLVGTLPGSGTYGVEMAMRSLFRPGDRVLILSMGKFSERWVQYGHLIGLEVLTLQVPWGESIQADQVHQLAADQPDLAGAILTHSETSTGAVIDLEEMTFGLRRSHPNILLVVDAITSVGTLPYYHDAWGIDASIVASQKALLNPAGLVAFALSERAQDRLAPSFAGDFANLYNFAERAKQHAYPFTPPTPLLYGLEAALAHLRTHTLPRCWNDTRQSAQVFRQGLQELGGELFAAQPSDSLSAFRWPGVNLPKLKEDIARETGLTLAGGQGPLQGQVLRVSHMGEANQDRMQELLQAMQALGQTAN